jgi:hypothetical protein
MPVRSASSRKKYIHSFVNFLFTHVRHRYSMRNGHVLRSTHAHAHAHTNTNTHTHTHTQHAHSPTHPPTHPTPPQQTEKKKESVRK